MAEWLVEEGIGEHRAVLVEGGHILAAKLEWPGSLAAGLVEDARLIARPRGSSRGLARFANGEEALVDRLPLNAVEGAVIRLEVTRAAIAEQGRFKRAQARPTQAPPQTAPSLAQRLQARVVRSFQDCDWDELWSEAYDGAIAFAGGSLQVSPTPAMTLIDIDGPARGRELALAAVAPLAQALRRFDLGGSIGVDFPTLEAKVDRRAVDEALAVALDDWPHERTAMNGFGFVQIVARLTGPSLSHRLHFTRTGACARRLLRLAERVAGYGPILLTAHPVLLAALQPDWLTELERRTGRAVTLAGDPGLALDGSFAQAAAA